MRRDLHGPVAAVSGCSRAATDRGGRPHSVTLHPRANSRDAVSGCKPCRPHADVSVDESQRVLCARGSMASACRTVAVLRAISRVGPADSTSPGSRPPIMQGAK
jgi:hypothetical protein